jgi:hypothetical protein
MRTPRYVSPLLALLLAAPLAAQGAPRQLALLGEPDSSQAAAPAAPAAGDTTDAAAARLSTAPVIQVQHLRAYDQRGVNVFEAPKEDATPYTGFKLDWGAAFNQPFQSLEHRNTAAARPLKDAAGKEYDANQLIDMGAGFNLANANLVLNAQVAPGIRVNLETYLSSRHHNETWVKGGYLQIDESPIDLAILKAIMDYTTLKVGMFEINYGDSHFRRSDGGQVLYNAFVENNLLDSFNMEIGAEAYLRRGAWLAMLGVTDGQNKGGILTPEQRGPAFYGKAGFDRQISPRLRVRLTGSLYDVRKTPSANLFGGDRAGSHYFYVLENTVATTTAQAQSGRLNPGLTNSLRAMQLNPFVKLGGLELFGVVERAEGKATAETQTRAWEQYVAEAVYRFLPGEPLYVGARYNTVQGQLRGMAAEVGVDRTALAAGWYITPNILMKGEYVTQRYHDFPAADIRNGGRFDGFVVEAGLAF